MPIPRWDSIRDFGSVRGGWAFLIGLWFSFGRGRLSGGKQRDWCSVSISLMEHTGREHIGDNLHGSVPYGYFGYSLALYLMMV
jgi:hypothetical protein